MLHVFYAETQKADIAFSTNSLEIINLTSIVYRLPNEASSILRVKLPAFRIIRDKRRYTKWFILHKYETTSFFHLMFLMKQ